MTTRHDSWRSVTSATLNSDRLSDPVIDLLSGNAVGRKPRACATWSVWHKYYAQSARIRQRKRQHLSHLPQHGLPSQTTIIRGPSNAVGLQIEECVKLSCAMAIYEWGLVTLLLSLALTRVAADGVSSVGKKYKTCHLKCSTDDSRLSLILKTYKKTRSLSIADVFVLYQHPHLYLANESCCCRMKYSTHISVSALHLLRLKCLTK